jgi:hypothetical protein
MRKPVWVKARIGKYAPLEKKQALPVIEFQVQGYKIRKIFA